MANRSRPCVLMVFDGFLVGGTETHVLSLAEELIRQGVRVIVCADRGPMQQEFQRIGCAVHVLPFRHALTATTISHLERRLRHIIRDEHIHCVHAHQMGSGRIAYAAARALARSMVITVHGTYYSPHRLRAMQTHGVRIVSVSPPVANWLKANGVTSTLVPNGIPVHIFRPSSQRRSLCRNTYHIPEGVPVVLYASRLSWQKANVCKRVITAAHLLQLHDVPNLHMVIAGHGQHAANVRRHAARLFVGRRASYIHFLGVKRHMADLYNMADVVVGTGRVALEAMACSRPVIAMGSRGYFGLLQSGSLERAWQHYFGDHKALQSLQTVQLERELRTILLYPHVREAVAKTLRTFVVRRFRSDKMASHLRRIYRIAPAVRR